MPRQILLPTSVADDGSDWTGTDVTISPAVVRGAESHTQIDEGVARHDSSLSEVAVDPVNDLPGPFPRLLSTLTIEFENPTIGATYTDVAFRVVFAYSASGYSMQNVPRGIEVVVELLTGSTLIKSCALRLAPGVGGLEVPPFFVGSPTCWNGAQLQSGYLLYEKSASGSWNQAQADDFKLHISLVAFQPDTDIRVTAADLVVTNGTNALTPSSSEVISLTETGTVPEGTSTTSGSEKLELTDSATVDQVPPDPIDPERPPPQLELVTGRSDITCRAHCGSFARVREELTAFADGIGNLLLWDGVADTAESVSTAPKLPFVVSLRDRLFLFGDLALTTGTVDTVAGIKSITRTDASWGASVAGKPIAISGAKFGTACQTLIELVAGTVATLREPPDISGSGLGYAVFGDAGSSRVQWSAANDPRDWTASALSVGPLDGDIPTGAFTMGDFLVMGKRSKMYRLDWENDPATDPILTQLFDNRGLVAHGAVVVLEGTAYIMDQQPSYFYVSRGGRFQPFDIGNPVRRLIDPGGSYELDWGKSGCWFAWWNPQEEAVCWAATLKGESYPRVVFTYHRPQIEGSDEPGRWTVRTYSHYILAAANGQGADGVMRAYLAVADPDKTDRVYLVSDDGTYGDMALGAYSGTVSKQTDNKKYDLGSHTKLRKGSLVEIDGESHSVDSDDGTIVTLNANFSKNVDGKTWRAGWRAEVTFRTIYLNPSPTWGRVRLEQVYSNWERVNSGARLRLSVLSDGHTGMDTILGGGGSDDYGFPRQSDRVVSLGVGVEGYSVQAEIKLLSPDGLDRVHDAVFLVRKYPPPEIPSE